METLDSLKVAKALNKGLNASQPLQVMIQVNTSGEQSETTLILVILKRIRANKRVFQTKTAFLPKKPFHYMKAFKENVLI